MEIRCITSRVGRVLERNNDHRKAVITRWGRMKRRVDVSTSCTVAVLIVWLL